MFYHYMINTSMGCILYHIFCVRVDFKSIVWQLFRRVVELRVHSSG